jgi:cytochrome d ubiquinol oxidase subunit I
MAATPLGFVAVLAGWTVTETGRQPFVVYGMLRTADAVAPVTAGAVTTSLILALAIDLVVALRAEEVEAIGADRLHERRTAAG